MSDKKKDPHLPEVIKKSYNDFLKSIDSFFHDAFQNLHNNGMFYSQIPVQTYETDSDFVIEAQLPGVKKEQIILDVYQSHVKIGVKQEEFVEEKNDVNKYVSQQYSTQVRERVIPLPFPVTQKDVKAKYQNGLLTIKVPNRRHIIDIE
ncbi:Hsp20/alpha crystallin family protein [Alkalihalobacterium elongatum]|uniref:Hsp20/alpha crystallin family protein n=1 Tax=Alkalihalobacterium elongatum TaxID=2675466 RepID=UPI001C1FB04A|nr:Hsp20/alpha crystallin family protein [Alkalihalobacterium elongatum]